jgi:CRP/FNR family cyclic AMP-dependent transcriptional regulator
VGHIILDGEAEILVDGPSGPELVAILGRDTLVGEIAILCNAPRTASVRARQHLVCLRIDKDVFVRLINEFPRIAIAVAQQLAHRLSQRPADSAVQN